VTFVHCGHRVQWIQDIFACLDRWILTDIASPGSLHGIMPGFPVEEGGYGKIGDCSDITYFTYFLSMDHVTSQDPRGSCCYVVYRIFMAEELFTARQLC